MLRNLEVLVNSICDDEIKKYMEEALRCYYSQSYRGCVILSVIAGIHDLRFKVKNLANSIEKFKDLDDKLEEMVENHKVIERYLIEQCATAEIDLLSKSEMKELERILDIRNECAHPNEYECTAETAIAIFTKLIDLLLSKPQLLGMQHINILVQQLKEDNFFPIDDKNNIRNIVIENLKTLNKRAYIPLAKKLVGIIENEDINMNFRENAIKFLANMNNVLDGKLFSDIIVDLVINDRYISKFFELLKWNVELLDIIDEINYSKMLVNINKVLNANNIINKENIIEIILNNEISKLHSGQIIDILTTKINNNKLYAIKKLIKGEEIYIDKQLLIDKLKDKIINDRNLNIYKLEDFNEIILLVGDDEVFDSIGWNIGYRINTNDFETSNNACNVLLSLSKEAIDKIVKFRRIELMSGIINSDYSGAFKAQSIIRDMDNCIFAKSFIDGNLTKEELEKFIDKSVTSGSGMKAVLIYIQKNNSLMISDIVEKLKNMVNDNFDKDKLWYFCNLVKIALKENDNEEFKNTNIEVINSIMDTIENE